MDIVNQFKLPKYIKGKSFSEASQMLRDKIRDKETLEEMIGRLRDAQEYSKQVQQAQEAQANPQMQQQVPQGQPQMVQQQGGQFAMGGSMTEPVDPKKKKLKDKAEKATTPSKLNTTNQDILKYIGEGMSAGLSPERQRLRDEVVSNEGSFQDNANFVNENVGNTWEKDKKNLYIVDHLSSKPHLSANEQKKLKAAKHAIKVNDYYGAKRTNSLDRQMGVGAYLNQNQKASGGYMGIGKGTNDRSDGFYDDQMAKEDAAIKTVDGVKDGVATAIGPIGMAFRAVQGLGKSAGNAMGGSGGALVAGLFSPEEGTISGLMDKDNTVGEKLLSTIPGVGAVMAKKKQDARAREARNNSTFKFVNSQMKPYAAGGYLNAVPGAVGMGQDMFGKGPDADNVDPNSKRTDMGDGIAAGATSGAAQGSQFGGYGAAIGAGLGAIAGGIKTSKANKALQQAKENAAMKANNEVLNPYAKGGYMNRYDGVTLPTGFMDTIKKVQQGGDNFGGGLDFGNYGPFKPKSTPQGSTVNVPSFKGDSNDYHSEDMKRGNVPGNTKILASNTDVNPINDGFYSGRKFEPKSKEEMGYTDYVQGDNNLDGFNDEEQAKFGSPDSSNSNEVNKAGKKRNYAELLRYAPAAMNALQLAKLKKPEHEKYDRLGDKYVAQRVDEKRMLNQINNSSNNDATVEASGGSLARYATLNKASQLQKTRAKSKAFATAEAANRAEKEKAYSYNKDTNMRNAATQRAETVANAQNRAAYDNNKSKLMSQIGNDLGGIGKEELFKKQAEEIYGYKWDGEYFVNKDGEKVTEKEMRAKQEAGKKQNKNMFGGYLNKKKKK